MGGARSPGARPDDGFPGACRGGLRRSAAQAQPAGRSQGGAAAKRRRPRLGSPPSEKAKPAELTPPAPDDPAIPLENRQIFQQRQDADDNDNDPHNLLGATIDRQHVDQIENKNHDDKVMSAPIKMSISVSRSPRPVTSYIPACAQ